MGPNVKFVSAITDAFSNNKKNGVNFSQIYLELRTGYGKTMPMLITSLLLPPGNAININGHVCTKAPADIKNQDC